jgi:hypothetical protein
MIEYTIKYTKAHTLHAIANGIGEIDVGIVVDR